MRRHRKLLTAGKTWNSHGVQRKGKGHLASCLKSNCTSWQTSIAQWHLSQCRTKQGLLLGNNLAMVAVLTGELRQPLAQAQHRPHEPHLCSTVVLLNAKQPSSRPFVRSRLLSNACCFAAAAAVISSIAASSLLPVPAALHVIPAVAGPDLVAAPGVLPFASSLAGLPLLCVG